MQCSEWHPSVVSQGLHYGQFSIMLLTYNRTNEKKLHFNLQNHFLVLIYTLKIYRNYFKNYYFCELERTQRIVGDWWMRSIHLIHPSKHAKWRTWDKGFLPRILQTETALMVLDDKIKFCHKRPHERPGCSLSIKKHLWCFQQCLVIGSCSLVMFMFFSFVLWLLHVDLAC